MLICHCECNYAYIQRRYFLDHTQYIETDRQALSYCPKALKHAHPEIVQSMNDESYMDHVLL